MRAIGLFFCVITQASIGHYFGLSDVAILFGSIITAGMYLAQMISDIKGVIK